MGQSPTITCPLCGADAKVFATLVKDGKTSTAAWCANHAAAAGVWIRRDTRW